MAKLKEERVKSGIPGLDKLLNGGFLRNSSILLSGTAGAGKTIFCSQFLYQGAKSYNEPGVYISFEEPVENIKRNVLKFGIDFDEVGERVSLTTFDPRRHHELDDLLRTSIATVRAKRVVIDSIVAWGLYLGELAVIRRRLLDLSMTLRELGCTTIFASEIPTGSEGISRFKVEEFVADCVILLNYFKREKTFERSLLIWKMRGSEHSRSAHPFQITEKGIVVYPEEVVI